MRKTLLFTTMLLVATSAFAFGGIFGGGSHKSHTYNGVDSIGVHYNGEDQADIQTSCPQHSEWSDIECVCESGWTMDGNICRPNSKPVCEDEGMYWCTTTQTCVADVNACMALCPDDRKCGDVCCGEGNVCNPDTNTCCYQDLEGNMDEGMCCDSSGSIGYGTAENDWAGGCCPLGSKTYISYYSDEEEVKGTACCAYSVYRTLEDYMYDEDENLLTYYEQGCCTTKIYSGIGFKGWDVCCDHEPTEYTDYKGNTFKVCWNNETNCQSNKDCEKIDGCSNGSCYCNLTTDYSYNPWSLNYPNQGVCEQISGTSAYIAGLGNVVMSDNDMTWWAANNWCKQQGKTLIPIEDFLCYSSGSNTLITSGSGGNYDLGGCCRGNNVECEAHPDWYNSANSDKISQILVNLVQEFGAPTIWTASDYWKTSTYSQFLVYLDWGKTDRNGQAGMGHALCK